MRRAVVVWLWLLLAAALYTTGCTVVNEGEPVEPDPGLVTMVWERSFGESMPGIAYAVQQTADGGLIVAGQGFSGTSDGDGEPFLLRTDASGVRLWRRRYGLGGKGAVFSVWPVQEDGFIATGKGRPGGRVFSGLYLLRTGADGVAEWERVFGSEGNACGLHAFPDGDGGYVACGLIELTGGGQNLYLVRTDAAGRARWERSFGKGEESTGQFVLPTSKGGFVVVGWTKPEGDPNRNVYVTNVDSRGVLEWEGSFGGTADEIGFFAQEEKDGGFTIVGQHFSYASSGTGIYLIRLDEAGELLWEKYIGGSNHFLGLSVHPAGDGSCLALGQVVGPDGYRNIGLAGLDRDGSIAWETIFGGAGDGGALSAIETAEGDYVVAGWVEAPGSGLKNVYLARLKP